jgi:hypothetical protein
MSDQNSGLIETLERLKRALRTTEDASLAAELGMSKEALSNRKRRNSLPKEAIDQLIVSKGLSPDYVYDGAGSVFVEDEHGHTWQQGFTQRLAAELGESDIAWLQREGHAVKAVKAVTSGKQPPPLELLRDMRRFLKSDLNHVFTGEITEAPSIVEEAMLKLFRNANAEAQQATLASLVVANQKPAVLSELPGATQRAGNNSIQIAGSVSGEAAISTGDTHAAKAKRKSPLAKRR